MALRFKSHAMLLALMLTVACCKPRNLSHPLTDLGPSGNAAVASQVAAYHAKNVHCESHGSGKRVLLTGFGLFTGVDYNISGVVIASMANPSFWPDQLRLGGVPPALAPVASGSLDINDLGGRARSRVLRVDDQVFDVCFLTVDVLWDQAAAVILDEARRFQPELIVMTGRGADNVVFEGGASNAAAMLSGYNSDGSSDTDNEPVASYVLPPADPGVTPTVALSWNNQAAKTAAASAVERIDQSLEVEAPSYARGDNDYVCNNVSYVVQMGINGVPLHLAGGQLTLNSPATAAKVGFMHFPAAATNDPASVRLWGEVLARAVESQFPP